MKKVIFSILVLVVLITASCSVTAGIPWLYGGWGFFVDFGISIGERGNILDDGFLSLEQNGKNLTGTLEIKELVYDVKGSYLENGTIVLKLYDGEEFLYELNGKVVENKLEGIPEKTWHAEKEL